MSVVSLPQAAVSNSGGKAAALSRLVRAGFPVPDGFVVTADAYRAVSTTLGLDNQLLDSAAMRTRILQSWIPPDLVDSISRALERLTDGALSDHVAVRSSATTEDGALASTAGQHHSVLAVRGTEQVCRAVLACWASLWTERAVAYRSHNATTQDSGTAMAVLVQRFVDADVSGVMFTAATGGTSVIEASWGLGAPIVAGHVTPDLWRVADTGILARQEGSKTHRTDRSHARVVTRAVPPDRRRAPCLPDRAVTQLHGLGRDVAETLEGPTDIEWAIAHGSTWILQARPVTAALPDLLARAQSATSSTTLVGLAASPGTATGTVCIVTGPSDFARVRPRDVLVCRDTDPAWTPLFSIASAVVTETGGVLSHAAIVAREVGIPAVLSVPQATTTLGESSTVSVDGNAGLVLLAQVGRCI